MIYLPIKKLTIDDMDIFVARNHNLPSEESELSEFKEDKLSMYLNDPRYIELIDLNANYRHLEGIGVLYAHGAILRQKWVYDDSNKLNLVQDWVDKYDGKYNLLILCCHAPENINIHNIHSRKSILLLPDDAYTKNRTQEHVKSKLFVPRMGLMEFTNIDNIKDYFLL